MLVIGRWLVGGGDCHRETNFAQTSTPNLILRVMSVPVDCQVTPCALSRYGVQLSVFEEANRTSKSDQCSTCSSCMELHTLFYFFLLTYKVTTYTVGVD